mmetsp:Transcript_10737/g.24362  ORF Transcript_10737/g.24362 Transcript_10737/m.24362 type:complete len:139 (+) Transcript_10737:585-1001(+)
MASVTAVSFSFRPVPAGEGFAEGDDFEGRGFEEGGGFEGAGFAEADCFDSKPWAITRCTKSMREAAAAHLERALTNANGAAEDIARRPMNTIQMQRCLQERRQQSRGAICVVDCEPSLDTQQPFKVLFLWISLIFLHR